MPLSPTGPTAVPSTPSLAGTRPDRRQFLVDTAASGLALGLGWAGPANAAATVAASAAAGEDTELGVWVVVRPDDRCIVRIARTTTQAGGFKAAA